MASRYTPEQLNNARLIASRAEQEGVDPRLGLIAALTESNLTNIQGGDRDSVGLFQMRTGIWDQGKYKGYQKDVNKQLDWFFDTAKRADRGSNLGEWAANIERPAAQYRGRYATHMGAATDILRQIGNTSGYAPSGDRTGTGVDSTTCLLYTSPSPRDS